MAGNKGRQAQQNSALAGHMKTLHRRTTHHLRHAFVPHAGNDYRPHALRPRALTWYAVLLIAVKLGITGLLFSVYPTPGYYSTATVERFLTLTNSARSASKVAGLKLNTTLSKAAANKADAILKTGQFAHTINGKRFFTWINDVKYGYSFAGENLALDFADADLAQEALMNSPGHRANILNNRFTEIGLAVKSGTFQGRQTTVLVELFAKPLPVVAKPKPKPAVATTAPRPTTPTRTNTNTAPRPANVNSATTPTPVPVIPEYQVASVTVTQPNSQLVAAERTVVTVEAKNTGAKTWEREGLNSVSLTAIDHEGDKSVLANDTWTSNSVAAQLSTMSVKPNEVGRWEVTLVGPATEGTYLQRFALATHDGKPIADSEVTVTIHVPPAVAAEVTPTPSLPSVATAAAETGSSEATPTAPRSAPAISVLAGNIVKTGNTVFLFFLVFLTGALLVNLLVRYEVQHRHIVLGTLTLIVLAGSMLVYGFHFLNPGGLPPLQVLGQ